MIFIVANNIQKYLQGKCDGIRFSDVEKKDIRELIRIAKKYGKEYAIFRDGRDET